MHPLPAYRLAPLLWLLFSVLLYLAGSHARHFLNRERFSAAGRFLETASIQRLVQLLYYIGIPYIALLRGDLLARLMGLTDLRWLDDIGIGVAFAVGMIILSTLAFRYARGRSNVSLAYPLAAPAALWQAAELQVHWTFYRAALIQVTGDVYWGAFLSLLPIGLELGLNPTWRRRLLGAGAGQEAARLTLLVATTGLYILARNLVVLVAVHWLTELALVLALGGASQTPEEGEDIA